MGSSSDALARLLGMGTADADGNVADEQETKRELLRLRLAGTMPLDPKVLDRLPAILGRLRDLLLPLGGRPLGDVLLDESTDLEVIVAIKAYGKETSGEEEDSPGHSVALAIYYAAIASALVFHDQRITTRPFSYLAQAFGALMERSWVTPELSRHFAKARQMCRKKQK